MQPHVGVWGCRMSCIKLALPRGRVTNGGAFCNKRVLQGGVWASGTSMEGEQSLRAWGASHQSDFVAVACDSHVKSNGGVAHYCYEIALVGCTPGSQ